MSRRIPHKRSDYRHLYAPALLARAVYLVRQYCLSDARQHLPRNSVYRTYLPHMRRFTNYALARAVVCVSSGDAPFVAMRAPYCQISHRRSGRCSIRRRSGSTRAVGGLLPGVEKWSRQGGTRSAGSGVGCCIPAPRIRLRGQGRYEAIRRALLVE